MTEQPGSSDHPAALVLLVCTTSAPNLHRMNATPTVAAPSASPRAPRSREIGMRQLTGRHSTFLAKLAGVAALIGAADQLMFYDSLPGATLGVFALLWAGVLPILRPDLRGSRRRVRDRAGRRSGSARLGAVLGGDRLGDAAPAPVLR
jgi:hypothetical protein